MVCVGDRIQSGRPCQQPLDASKVAVYDGVYEGREVVVVDQVDGLGILCDQNVSFWFPLDESLVLFLLASSSSNMSKRPCMLA